MERGGGGAGPSCASEEDAPFRSRAVAEKVRQHPLWHGDLLADPASFAAFRAWLEERLPRVTQTPEGYFTAALVRNSLGRGGRRHPWAQLQGCCGAGARATRACTALRARSGAHAWRERRAGADAQPPAARAIAGGGEQHNLRGARA